ncbi:MAG: NifU family protein [Candidatus Nitronauta litoralis]|uniref:NifU family protein n=1 Tax=Candidatus Nitronauta litoralis TaxID=2705533 RepID=A0A7T0FYS9_9BACT|nr:MAG: NifU family protein [Candidatus Nitronauta litoralis]
MKISEILAAREKKTTTPTSGNTGTSTPPAGTGKKPIKVVRTRETPNPNAKQYVLNTQVLSYGKRSYSGIDECGDDAMAKSIFDFDGIKNVYIMNNFVTVTKADAVGWNPLEKQVWKVIDDKVTIYPAEETEKIEVEVKDFLNMAREKQMQAVEMVLNRSIRHSLAQDGGGVELKDVEGTEVKIHYQGACGDCPSSTTGTLQHIERLIKQQLHPDLVVKPV